MKLKDYIMVLFMLTFSVYTGQAQDNDTFESKLGIQFILGGKVGGASPLPLPKEIRKIKSYNPNVPFFGGVKVSYILDPKWSVLLGLVFEGKGMDAEASVKGYKTTFNAVNDSKETFRGYYTGDITTKVHNLYLTVPVQARYALSDKWDLLAGPYISFAVKKEFYGEAYDGYAPHETPVGDKITIDRANYNFEKSVRTIDLGMSMGTDYHINKKFFAMAQFDYGFNNIMQSGFESISFGLHNVFLNIGVGYQLR